MSTWAKSTARIAWACAVRNCRQVGPERRGAGSRPAFLRIVQTVDAAIWWPRPTSSPWMRRYPHVGSPGPSAAPAPGPSVRRAVGRVVVADRSSGGQRAGHASAAGFSVTRAAAGADGGQQPAQRAEHGAVHPAQPRARGVSAQHGHFVTQDQDLDVLSGVGAGEQRQPAQHAGEHQVRESESHSARSCCPGCSRRARGPPVDGDRAGRRPCQGSRHPQAGTRLMHVHDLGGLP